MLWQQSKNDDSLSYNSIWIEKWSQPKQSLKMRLLFTEMTKLRNKIKFMESLIF